VVEAAAPALEHIAGDAKTGEHRGRAARRQRQFVRRVQAAATAGVRRSRGAPGAAPAGAELAAAAELPDAFTMTWVLVVVADTAMHATTTVVVVVCVRSLALNQCGAKMRTRPTLSGIQCPVSLTIPFPEYPNPVIGTLPVYEPPSGALPVTDSGALPVTDIGMALPGNAEPRALTGAESATAPWLPMAPGRVAVSRIGTWRVVAAVPTVIVQL
jgi:hypothetical protein